MERFIDFWAFAAALCGIGYMGWVFYKQRLVAKSQSWPSTPGTVTRSELGTSRGTSGPGRTPNRTFSARIEYRYMVGPKVYRNNTICIGGELNTSFRSRAESRLRQYPEGAEVPVFYDPANPARSCLERRGEIALFGYLIGSVFALIGLLILFDIIALGR